MGTQQHSGPYPPLPLGLPYSSNKQQYFQTLQNVLWECKSALRKNSWDNLKSSTKTEFAVQIHLKKKSPGLGNCTGKLYLTFKEEIEPSL